LLNDYYLIIDNSQYLISEFDYDNSETLLTIPYGNWISFVNKPFSIKKAIPSDPKSPIIYEGTGTGNSNGEFTAAFDEGMPEDGELINYIIVFYSITNDPLSGDFITNPLDYNFAHNISDNVGNTIYCDGIDFTANDYSLFYIVKPEPVEYVVPQSLWIQCAYTSLYRFSKIVNNPAINYKKIYQIENDDYEDVYIGGFEILDDGTISYMTATRETDDMTSFANSLLNKYSNPEITFSCNLPQMDIGYILGNKLVIDGVDHNIYIRSITYDFINYSTSLEAQSI
jgi:hypothetical protein